MSDFEKIPPVERLVDTVIARLFDRFRLGQLDLPPLNKRIVKKTDRTSKQKETVALWHNGGQFDSQCQYAFGLGRTFERRGSVDLRTGNARAENLFQIRVRILTDDKIVLDEKDEQYKYFTKEFRRAVASTIKDISVSNDSDFQWLRNFSIDGEFSNHQVKNWLEFSAAPPPRLLTSPPRNINVDEGLRPGDVIFHGDDGGRQEGTLALVVEKNGRRYGLSAAHVVSLFGRAVLETDVFVRQKGTAEASRRRRVGQFAEPATAVGAFQDEAVVSLDAALFLLSAFEGSDEFELGRHWCKVTGIASLAPSEQDERPPILMIRPGYALQIAEVAAINAATVMIGENDALLFYEGLLELRKVKRNTSIVPHALGREVKMPGKVSKAGDSGTLLIALRGDTWHEQKEFDAVGLIVGGNASSGGMGLAYALPMTKAQSALDFQLPKA